MPRVWDCVVWIWLVTISIIPGVAHPATRVTLLPGRMSAHSPAVSDRYEYYVHELSWGGTGSGNGEFDGPIGMCSDGHGNIYVCDAGNRRVQKFDSLGNFLMIFGGCGVEPGHFQWPRDVAVDDDGYVYVTDYHPFDWSPCWVQKFDSLGNFVLRWGGSSGLGPGEFRAPTGIAIGDSGDVFVADKGYRIQRFTTDGDFDTLWTHPDTSFIGGDAVGTSPGSVYTHWITGGDRLFRHDRDGNIILSFASAYWIEYPKDLATDGRGNLYVADWGATRIFKYDSLGSWITYVDPWWSGPQFESVGGIAVDGSENLYFSDTARDQVHKGRLLIVEAEEDWGELTSSCGARLGQNAPNPFRGRTAIPYTIGGLTVSTVPAGTGGSVHIRLEVFNLVGQHVRTLVDGEQEPGRYSTLWDGCSDGGQHLASGIYVYRLRVGDWTTHRRCVLIR